MSTRTAFTCHVGDRIPKFIRDSGFAYWNRYAAVNDEFVPIHMEDSAGQAVGYPTAIGMGNLTWAYLHLALHQWMGEDGRIVRLSTQFRSAIARGKQVVVTGQVSSVRIECDESIIDLELRVEDGDGSLLAPASATVAIC